MLQLPQTLHTCWADYHTLLAFLFRNCLYCTPDCLYSFCVCVCFCVCARVRACGEGGELSVDQYVWFFSMYLCDRCSNVIWNKASNGIIVSRNGLQMRTEEWGLEFLQNRKIPLKKFRGYASKCPPGSSNSLLFILVLCVCVCVRARTCVRACACVRACGKGAVSYQSISMCGFWVSIYMIVAVTPYETKPATD